MEVFNNNYIFISYSLIKVDAEQQKYENGSQTSPRHIENVTVSKSPRSLFMHLSAREIFMGSNLSLLYL